VIFEECGARAEVKCACPDSLLGMDKCNEETPDLPAAQSQGPDPPLDTTGPGLATWTDKDSI